MKRYIAIDAGKFACKYAEFDPETKSVKKGMFRTSISLGDFRDDAQDKNTYIAQIDGVTYNVGKGNDAELSSSKLSETHRISALTAIALLASDDEEDEINVAAGLPAKTEWSNVEKRVAFQEFMFPQGVTYEISLKTSPDAPVKTKRFHFGRTKICAESIGALFMDDSPFFKNPVGMVGVLDIGNLNLNATLWNGIVLDPEASLTSELGGSILIHELSQELSTRFSRCDERYVSSVLRQKPENRCLRPNNGNKEVMEQSKILIDNFLLDFVKRIRRDCDAKKWSIEYMSLIAIGGTTKILANELMEVFGENLVILSDPTYCNVLGFLRILCAQCKEIGYTIPLADTLRQNSAKKTA